MLLIQTTKKLTEQLNEKYSKEQIIENDPIYAWHANVFLYKRRKYVLVMNNKSRYNFILGSMVKKDFMQFPEQVRDGMKENLMADGFDDHLIKEYLSLCDQVHFAPTSDRRIISQMTEMISITKHMWNVKGLESQDIDLHEQNRWNNKVVMLTLPETYAVEAMGNMLGGLGGDSHD